MVIHNPGKGVLVNMSNGGDASWIYGIVVSANCDKPTRLLHPAAKQAAAVFRQAGLKVIELYGEKAVAANVFNALADISTNGHSLAGVFIVAHGSERALYGSDDLPIYETKMRQFLRGSIVIANCCLGEGTLAKEMTAELCALATIGYSPYLRVKVNLSGFSRIFGLLFSKTPLNGIVDCSALPLRKLIEDDMTVSAALEASRKAWHAIAKEWLPKDRTLARALLLNKHAMRYWGRGASRMKKAMHPWR